MAASAATELKVLINILSQGTALPSLLNQVNNLSKGLTALQQQVNKIPTAPPAPPVPPISSNQKEMLAYLENLDKAASKLVTTFRFLAGGFLSLQAVRFVKDLADGAARVEMLTTVLHTVALNAGYTAEEIDKADKAIQRMGITMQASKQSLTQFVQAGLPVDAAPKLARAAQNLATISGLSSSDTFQRMLTNIQQLDTLGLRWMGLVVDRTEAYTKFAAKIGLTADALTKEQQQEALLNEVIEKTNRTLGGAYVNALDNVGKQTLSLVRITQDFADTIGSALTPAYSALVMGLTRFLERAKLHLDVMMATSTAAREFGASVDVIVHGLQVLGDVLIDNADAVWLLVKAYIALRAATLFLGGWAKLAVEIRVLIAGFQGMTGAVGGLGVAMAALEFVSILGLLYALGVALTKAREGVMNLWEAFKRGEFLKTLTKRDKDDFFRQLLGLEGSVDAGKTDAQKIIDNIHKIQDDLDAAAAAYNAADDKRKLAAQGGLQQKERDDAQRLFNEAKEKRDATQKLLDERIANLQRKSPEIAAEQARQALLNKEAERLRKLGQAGDQAVTELFGQKTTFVGPGIAVTTEFTKNIAAVKERFRTYDEIWKQQGGALNESQTEFINKNKFIVGQMDKGVRELVPSVTNAESLRQFEEVITEFKKRGGDAVTAVQALQNARRNAQKGELEFNAQNEADREAHFKERERRVEDSASSELSILKTKNAALAAEDKRAYAHGLMTFDEYYDGLDARREIEARKELEQAELRVFEITQQQKGGFAKTAKDQEALETQRLAAVAKLRETQVRVAGERQAAGGTRDDARTTQDRELLHIQQQTAVTYGTQEAAIAQINKHYDELADQLGVVGDKQKEQVLIDAKTLEVRKVLLSFREQEHQQILNSIDAENSRLSVENSLLDVERRRIQQREAAGDVSPAEAMRQRNAVIYRQAALDQLQLSNKQLELDQKRAFYDQEKARIIQEQAGAPGMPIAPDAPATVNRLNTELGGTQKEIIALTGEVETLHAKSLGALDSLEFYGKEFKKSFSDNFASAIQESITNFKNAGDIWKNMAGAIANDIAGIFAKNLSQKIANLLFGGGVLSSRLIAPLTGGLPVGGTGMAEGGPVSGPGTGTSDSIPAMVSAGEHIMPAAKAAQFMPLLEGIRLGTILPYALGGMVGLQSLAIPPVIPRRYASGGMVVSDGGASQVQTGNGGPGNMIVSLHPDALNMTMREWLEQEVVRQQGRR